MQDDATFTITVDGKTFHFQAQDSEERERWIRALEDTVLRHNQTRRTTSSLRKSTLLIQGDLPPSIEDFDKKLSETDCYLQILLNQVAALKVKIGMFFTHFFPSFFVLVNTYYVSTMYTIDL